MIASSNRSVAGEAVGGVVEAEFTLIEGEQVGRKHPTNSPLQYLDGIVVNVKLVVRNK